MLKASTIQEYINLYNSGYSITYITVGEEIEEELISYVEENKDKSNNILNIYASWLLEGQYINKNMDQAVSIFKILANQGDATAQCNLGNCYYYGEGVPQDYERAVHWYQKAAYQGDATAQNNLGNCYSYGVVEEQSDALAVHWYQKAAVQGCAVAQNNLGYCYEKGQGVEKDYAKAIYWYEKSAEQGNARAQCFLGYCYEKGQGVEKDYAKAIYWYEKSAEQGNARAQCFLGYCYEKGQGVTQSYEQAVYWYEKSAEQGYSYSQFSLAFLYENGLGCEKNIVQASNWYQKAADYGNEDAKEALNHVSMLTEDINKSKEEKLHYCSRKDVFVSWNHKDKKIKDELFNRLEEKDILTVWESDGDGSGDLSDCIKNAITAAHSYVIILTGNSVQSRWVEKEVKEILTKAGDYEKIYKNLSHEDNAYKQTIRVILLNTITINDKKEYFDVEHYIKENLGEQSVFYKLLTLAWIFPVNNEIDYDKLELSLTKAIEWSYLLEYKKNIKGKYGVFTAVLTKVVENNDVKSGIISTALDFEKSYLNREVFDENEHPYSVEALLKLSNPVLIYGEGGTGKSFFLQNILRNYFDKNRYLFYLTSEAITKTINELNLDIIHILKEKCFNYAFTEEEQKKVSFEGFEQLFFENEIILLIDGLDELDTESKTVFFEKLEKFYDTYNKEKKLHIIFTSRTKTDRILIEKCFKKELSLFELRGIRIPFYWYEKSAEQGNARAQWFLGYCYEKGQGVTQSYEQAMDWYQKAAVQGNEDAKEALDHVFKIIEDIKCKEEKLHYCSRKDVFVSWNHKDKKIKDELFNRLEEKDILTVWESDGDGSGDLSDCIKKAITAAHSYVIILTGNSVQSRWVEKEVKEILTKAGEYEKTCKNLSNEKSVYKQTIRVILLNTITINDKKEFFDVENYIKDNLDEQSVFHKLLTLAWIFPVNNEIDYDKLEVSLTEAIEWTYLLEYKKNIKKKYGVFTAVLTNVVENNDVKSGIISTALDFEKSYLNREVFDENEHPYSVEALLKLSNPVLIYGEGGTGKSLFLQNILRNYFDKNRYLFYLTSEAIKNTINEPNLDLIHILKEKCFNFAFTEEEQKKVSFEGFEQLFFENEIILLIDALDELGTESKTVFFSKLEKFYDTYNKEKKLHIIFTSRTKMDCILIQKRLTKKELSLFELRGITKNDIENLYISMRDKYTLSTNEFSFSPDKQIFMNHLDKIQDDIKNNPLLISNLIFIYLTTKKLLDKKFDIIDTTVSIMVKDIEQEKNIEFKYLSYIQKNLYEFLGYIALNESNGNTESLETLTNDFFTEEVEKNQDDIEVVSAEICKFLKRRAIIVENHISHSIFSYFLVARYIFEEIYKSAKTSTMKKYLTFKDEKLLDDYIKDGFKKQEESWANISSDFLMKIDNEIYSFSKDAMNENHHSYDTFHITLTKTLKEKGFSETAIKVIEEMVKHNMFYFNDFIKKYI